jgi:hypothetical protein
MVTLCGFALSIVAVPEMMCLSPSSGCERLPPGLRLHCGHAADRDWRAAVDRING